MAKKQQAQFNGDGFPEKMPKPLTDARDDYLSAMRSSAKASEKKGDREQTLIEAMNKHKVDRIRLDGENRFFEVARDPKIKKKTIPKEQREEAEAK